MANRLINRSTRANLSILSRSLSTARASLAKYTYEQAFRKSIEEPEKYWGEKANLIEWFEKPKKILDRSNSPFDKW